MGSRAGKVVAIVMAGLLGIPAVVALARPSVPTPAPTFTGVQLFRGIFLGAGEVAERLYGERMQPMTPAFRAAEKKMLSDIRRVDPTFLRRFGRRAQSGNYSAIENALQEGTRIINALIRRQLGVGLKKVYAAVEERGTHPIESYTDTAVGTYEYVHTDNIVYQNGMTAIETFNMIDTYTILVAFIDPRGAMQHSDLARERVVNEVAIRLAS